MPRQGAPAPPKPESWDVIELQCLNIPVTRDVERNTARPASVAPTGPGIFIGRSPTTRLAKVPFVKWLVQWYDSMLFWPSVGFLFMVVWGIAFLGIYALTREPVHYDVED
jgi:hypothetical protein